MLFKVFLNEFNRKPSKIWLDKVSEFYNRSMKSWLLDINIEMYSVKSVVAGRFITILKRKCYKHMASISNNVYIDKLDDIVNEYNNGYHRTQTYQTRSQTYLLILV